LVSRLDQERGDVYLRWFGHAGRVAAAVAAIVLIAWGVYAWKQNNLPAVNMELAWDEAHNSMVAPPSGDVLAERFRRSGYDGSFPRDLNYSFLTNYGMREFQGRLVPQLIFQATHGGARAEVKVLSAKQFNLKHAPVDFQSPEGYPFKIELWTDSSGCDVLVNYTGDSAEWLRERPNR
jgi:hypothetical protein